MSAFELYICYPDGDPARIFLLEVSFETYGIFSLS